MRANRTDKGALLRTMDTRILRTLAGMEADPAQRLAVTRVAAQLGLSRCRFEHLFKESTGESFGSRLRRLRSIRAKSLLADCSLSIKEKGDRFPLWLFSRPEFQPRLQETLARITLRFPP
jgi:transcriptional regulator GlxA family with amidase domain